MMILDLTVTPTAIGPIALHALDGALVGVTLDGSTSADSGVARHLTRHLGAFTTRSHADAAGAATRLARYFGGDWSALHEQSVALHGTEFQLQIWNALRLIPAGTTWTYSQLAARIGRPTAVRAAGAANGANPVSLFMPCHRVIAADGTLWGYGGGLPRKAWLLRHEGATGVVNLAQGALPLT